MKLCLYAEIISQLKYNILVNWKIANQIKVIYITKKDSLHKCRIYIMKLRCENVITYSHQDIF